jgi:hypothetical protein
VQAMSSSHRAAGRLYDAMVRAALAEQLLDGLARVAMGVGVEVGVVVGVEDGSLRREV